MSDTDAIVKVHPLGWYMRQLDTSRYGSRAEITQAARQLRDADIAERNRQRHRRGAIRRQDREFEQWLRSQTFHSMAERRHAVRRGTHRWCSGLFGLTGCRNTGVIRGKRGVEMKCARCHGEGVRKRGRATFRRAATRRRGRRR